MPIITQLSRLTVDLGLAGQRATATYASIQTQEDGTPLRGTVKEDAPVDLEAIEPADVAAAAAALRGAADLIDPPAPVAPTPAKPATPTPPPPPATPPANG